MNATAFKCFIGLHNYEVINEEHLINPWGHVIGKVIVSRCKHCGKIINHVVKTCMYDQ